MAVVKKMSKKIPPNKNIVSVQFDLFKSFLTNDKSQVSNTVDIWENIPKYFFTPQQVKKLRGKDGLAKPYEWNYFYKDLPCLVEIQPATIKQKDGSYKAFFPGITEELVEEALKKILSDQQCGIHVPETAETWIKFTLRRIQKELKNRGRDRNLKEIKHAITVMNKCVISYSIDGKEVWSGSILQDLVSVDRDKYLTDSDSCHVARLPLFISNSINKLDYRQFNYSRLMHCDEQLSRWIYKRLINKYVNANYMNDYHFMFSGLKHSGLLQQATESRNRIKVLSALNELVERGVLMNFKTDEIKEGRKIIDVKYTVKGSQNFISEQKASNKRSSNNQLMANNKKQNLVSKVSY